MKHLLLEVPTSLVTINEDLFPGRYDSINLEHLVQYLRHQQVLPITEVIVNDSAIVVSGKHYFAKAAISLNRPNMRISVVEPSVPEAVQKLIGREDVKRLNLSDLMDEEAQTPYPLAWDVFFFERSLSPEEQRAFEEIVVERVRAIQKRHILIAPIELGIKQIRFDQNLAMAEFQAHFPIHDETWFSDYMASIKEFSKTRVRILSFNGKELAN
jgi:hypothetical protein